jgi:hypothetical protein
MNRVVARIAVLALTFGCGGTTEIYLSTKTENRCTNDGGIPDPGVGNQVDIAFVDLEPNDTPEQATPLGVSQLADLYPWVTGNKIGGARDAADYFVFQSASTAGEFEFDMCFMTPITGMTASLWKVVCGVQQTPPIGTWTITTTCTTNFAVPLEASTVYLFGVFATGGAGTYTA